MIAPQLRFKEFSDKWQVKNLEELSEVTTGNKDTQNKLDDGEFPFFVRSQTVEKINSYTCDGEAVLTSGDGVGVGKNFHYINGKFDYHQRVYCIFNFKSQVSGKYIFYYFSEKFNKRVMGLSAKNSVDSVRRSMITEMPISIPTLNEQTKIANFLTAVDEKISLLTQKHDLLTQYKKGMMQQIFSQELRFKDDDGKEFPEWEAALIGERINEKSAKFNPDKQSYFMKCIELEHLSQNTGELLGHTDTSTSKSIKNKFEKGDVLFGKLRPYLKKYLKAPFSGVCSTEIWVLKGRGISNEYLFQFVQTESFVTQTNISSGSKMPRADWGVVSCAYSYFPCPEEQIKIANFLTAIDKKITVTQTQLKAVKQYKQGLLQQMFV
jgi:type I restriction enzyme S subunit